MLKQALLVAVGACGPTWSLLLLDSMRRLHPSKRDTVLSQLICARCVVKSDLIDSRNGDDYAPVFKQVGHQIPSSELFGVGR